MFNFIINLERSPVPKPLKASKVPLNCQICLHITYWPKFQYTEHLSSNGEFLVTFTHSFAKHGQTFSELRWIWALIEWRLGILGSDLLSSTCLFLYAMMSSLCMPWCFVSACQNELFLHAAGVNKSHDLFPPIISLWAWPEILYFGMTSLKKAWQPSTRLMSTLQLAVLHSHFV